MSFCTLGSQDSVTVSVSVVQRANSSTLEHFYVVCCCRKPLNRRYIVVEGIYVNAGDLAPLQAICALKYKCANFSPCPCIA